MFNKSPIYKFESGSSTLVSRVPKNKIIYVYSNNTLYKKITNIGIEDNTTVHDAILLGNIEVMTSGGVNVYNYYTDFPFPGRSSVLYIAMLEGCGYVWKYKSVC